VGTGGRIVPSSVFLDLSTWHLIHQAYTRKSMHFAKELWTDYTDQALHRRLMDALEEQHGHRMLASVEAAKIACSISGDSAVVELDFLDSSLAPTVDAANMEVALHASLAQVRAMRPGLRGRCGLERCGRGLPHRWFIRTAHADRQHCAKPCRKPRWWKATALVAWPPDWHGRCGAPVLICY